MNIKLKLFMIQVLINSAQKFKKKMNLLAIKIMIQFVVKVLELKKIMVINPYLLNQNMILM